MGPFLHFAKIGFGLELPAHARRNGGHTEAGIVGIVGVFDLLLDEFRLTDLDATRPLVGERILGSETETNADTEALLLVLVLGVNPVRVEQNGVCVVTQRHISGHRDQHGADLMADGTAQAHGVVHALGGVLDLLEAAVGDCARDLRGRRLDGSELRRTVDAEDDVADAPAMIEADIDHDTRGLHRHGTEDPVAVHGGLDG